MFKKIFCIVFVVLFLLKTQGMSANFTNSSESSAYPFWYVNSDGTSNGFCNYIAMLNIVAMFYNPMINRAVVHAVKNIDQNIDEEIEEIIVGIRNSKQKIINTLNNVIVKFDNNINSSDTLVIQGMLDALNQDKCNQCLDKFAEIVSIKHDKKIKQCLKNNFHINNKAWTQQGHLCKGHIYQKIEQAPSAKKSTTEQMESACCGNWLHPFNWSNWLYGSYGVFGALGIAYSLDNDSRAGSFVGDIANCVNALTIPIANGVNGLQYWFNKDRTKAKKLIDAIEKELLNLDSVIEIAARVVGKMNNDISYNEARYLVTALALLGWPNESDESLVASFLDNASTITNHDGTKLLIDAVRSELEKNAIKYSLDYSLDESVKLKNADEENDNQNSQSSHYSLNDESESESESETILNQ